LNGKAAGTSGPSRWDWLLLIPLALTLTPVAVWVWALPYVNGPPFGAELRILFGLAASLPLFVFGLGWFCTALLVRSPLLRDFVGWAIRLWLAFLGCVVLFVGGSLMASVIQAWPGSSAADNGTGLLVSGAFLLVGLLVEATVIVSTKRVLTSASSGRRERYPDASV
jgi:hypothetical protein